MHEQITDCQLARHVRIPHLERRQIADDRGIPVDLALLHQQSEGRGGEQLGVRRDAKQRAGIDGRCFALLPDAEPCRDHDAAVLDDGERDARNVEGAHYPLNVGVEIGRSAGWRRNTDRRRGSDQCGSENNREDDAKPPVRRGRCPKHVPTVARGSRLATRYSLLAAGDLAARDWRLRARHVAIQPAGAKPPIRVGLELNFVVTTVLGAAVVGPQQVHQHWRARHRDRDAVPPAACRRSCAARSVNARAT